MERLVVFLVLKDVDLEADQDVDRFVDQDEPVVPAVAKPVPKWVV